MCIIAEKMSAKENYVQEANSMGLNANIICCKFREGDLGNSEPMSHS